MFRRINIQRLFCATPINFNEKSLKLIRDTREIEELSPLFRTALLHLGRQHEEYTEINSRLSSGDVNKEYMDSIRSMIFLTPKQRLIG